MTRPFRSCNQRFTRWTATALLVIVLVLPSAHADSLPGDPFATATTPPSALEDTKTPITLGGYLESRNQLRVHDADSPASLRQRLHLEGAGRWEPFSVFLSARVDAELAASAWDGDDHQYRAEGIHEAYATYDSEHLDLVVGRKIHRWGTGDGINPMDLINPMDVADPFASGNADNRLPVWLLDATVCFGKWALEGVFLPVAGVNDIPDQKHPWTSPGMNALYSMRENGNGRLEQCTQPNAWLHDAEFGGRLSTHLAGWDLAVLFYSGFVDDPLFLPTPAATPSLRATYPRFTAYGFNFARALGAAATIRGEAAYKPAYPTALRHEDSLGHRDLWQVVLGWDYDINGKYYMNFQIFGDALGGPFSPRDQDIAGASVWHGLAYELSVKWLNDDVKTGARGKIYTSQGGSLNELFGEYCLGDDWKLSAGVMLWSGNTDEILGQFDRNDLLYLTLRYSF